MGLFSRSQPTPTSRGIPGRLGPGRRIRVEAQLEQVADALESIVETYKPRQYPELPRVVPAGWTWLGLDEDRPDLVNSAVNHIGDPLYITLKSIPRETECGIFDPLGRGDGRVLSSLVRDLERRMPSIRSAEPFPPGTLVMAPPPIANGIIDDILVTAGRSLTGNNRTAIADAFLTNVKLKAAQAIEVKSDRAEALKSLDEWARIPGEPLAVAAAVLQYVADWDIRLVPYIQDFPLRVRAVMVRNSHTAGSFWDDLR